MRAYIHNHVFIDGRRRLPRPPGYICPAPLTAGLSSAFTTPAMSQKQTSARETSSSTSDSELRFQAIFQAALESYRKQTKKDLLAHPLASQLQSCDSTTAILALLQDQVREFDKSHSGDERLTRWLGPTVNVLFAFSATVSGGVSLVSLYTRANINLKLSSDICFSGVFACQRDLCRHRRLCLSKYPVFSSANRSHRRDLIGGPECCRE